MQQLHLRLSAVLALALGAATGAFAQTKPAEDADASVLPVWNNASGKVEALLLLEPTGQASTGARWRLGNGNSLDAAFGLSTGDSLGLLCDRENGLAANIGNLASHCMLTSLGDVPQDGKRIAASATLNRPGARLGLSAGTQREGLSPGWLSGGLTGQVEQNDLAVFGQKSIGREAFVSIGGAYARARLIPLSDAPAALADQWSSKSLSVGGGYGPFSANIVGRVIDVPGQPGKLEGLGVGLTWRTPWSGQLTLGAENVVTRGKNPFSTTGEAANEGTVPYVRYEQDL